MTTFSKIAVLGAGTMGQGIAQAAAQQRIHVALRDVDVASAEKGKAKVVSQLSRLVEKAKITADESAEIASRIAVVADVSAAVADADVVIEAIPERMEWKLDLFRAIDAAAPSHALLATNTSSLSVTEIAGATKRPERVVGLHFFNPVPVMELVEIVRGLRSSDAAIEQARAFTAAIAKRPIVVNDFPGFATSRLGVAIGAEAIRMLESGVASAADIDLAMELGYRHPMGPLKLTDLVGLDVRLAILEHLHKELGEQFRPPALLRQMVRAGKLGRKSGEGFYKY